MPDYMANVFAFMTSVSERTAAHPDGLADVLDELSHNVNRDSELNGIRLGVLISAVGRRSYGPLLLIIGLIAISPATILPFMTTIVAAITLLIAVQMALGFKRPWLPKRVLDIRVPRRAFFAFLDRARPIVERMDGVWLRERVTFMAAPPFVNAVALCVCAAALITFPLSLIPFAPLAPGIAIILFGLGMTARDGLWLSAGIVFTIGAFWLAAPLIF
ncbi:MAG: exopolysaccharide biosynthesis protein [Caulobacteraceae bacterium]